MSTSTLTVLITDGAGYLSTHVALALRTRGYRTIMLDGPGPAPSPMAIATNLSAEWVIGDVHDFYRLRHILLTYAVDAVLHFAPDNPNPGMSRAYYNGVTGTLTLLEAMLSVGLNKLVFSSTCATYGVPQQVPITETHPQCPVHLDGASQLPVERVLTHFDQAYSFQSVVFRHFNVAGADPQGRMGNPRYLRLIPLALLTALGVQPHLTVFGTDYDTPDGSCIRDFVHVSDVAQAYLLGLEYLLNGGTSTVFNLCSGIGFSVQQVIDTVRRVTQHEIPIVLGDRRPNDPPILIGNADKAQRILRWQPQYPKLQQIVRHAWRWQQYQASLAPSPMLTG